MLWLLGLRAFLGQSRLLSESLAAVAGFATLMVLLAAFLRRDTIRTLVEGFTPYGRMKYAALLQEFARALAAPATLPSVLAMMAAQVEEVFHPAGLALALFDDARGDFRVKLSQDPLASQPTWRQEAAFAPESAIPTLLRERTAPLSLTRHIDDVPQRDWQVWQQLLESGVCVLAPMYVGEQLSGWLALGARRPRLSYGRQDLDFLGALMDQSCIALENARLYGEMQRRATGLALVAMVSSAISSSLDLEQVLEAIVESVIQVVGCQKSAIFEISQDGTRLSLRTERGLGEAFAESSHDLIIDQDERAMAMASGEPLIVTDVRADPRLAVLAELAKRGGYRALIDVPLVGREGALGILSIYFGRVHIPAAGELELLTTFASQAAIAIENARLYEAVTRERDRARQLYDQTNAALVRRVEELTTIGEISRQLTSTLDTQKVMDLMLDRALQATRAECGVIVLGRPGEDFPRIVAAKGYPPVLDRYQSGVIPEDGGITVRVALEGVTALVPDVTKDPDYVPLVPSTRAQLSVPIVHEAGPVGVITLESDRPAAFTAEHARFVELLAEHAAIGISNAQLFQQVIEARDRLQVVLNSTHDLVVVLDTAGRVILTNPRVEEMFGSEMEGWLRSVRFPTAIQLLDSNALPYLEVNAQNLAAAMHRIQKHPDSEVDIAFGFRDKERLHYVEGTVSPMFHAAGEILGWVVVMREVTQRKEVERFREELSSMVIHNLQGPLAALISSLETMRGDSQLDSEMATELLNIALTSGHKLYRRIESLLWIRRLEEKRMPLNLQPLPLWAVVQPVVDEYMSLAQSVNALLLTEIAHDLVVVVDEEIIGRVFSNLLDNALKYVPEGGEVRVRAAIETRPDGPVALCSVSDTGPGISDSVKHVLFEKFRRGTPSPPSRRSGLGIGLHYCRVAVGAHGGTIWVESQKGQGSTFFFTLPVVADPAVGGGQELSHQGGEAA